MDPQDEPPDTANGKPMSKKRKAGRIVINILKIIAIFVFVFLFICSLDLLTSGFKLVGGKQIGDLSSNNELLMNPVVGVMIGILITVILQSSSSSTSVVITMVGSDMITVKTAIPIVMGSNVGTSITSSLVALTQASNRKDFSRAFAGATVHDMFNWLTVLVLLPLEITTGYLEVMTGAIVNSYSWEKKDLNQEFLKAVTKHLTDAIIKLNNTVINKIALDREKYLNSSLLNRCYDKDFNSIRCGYLVEHFDLDDTSTGIIVLLFSVFLLLFCLFMIIKILQSILQGQITFTINRLFNRDVNLPFCGYIALLVGCVMTILVQSSSVVTSALTPLAGIGALSLEKIYPIVLGSNIGTTTTSILAAFAADAAHIPLTLQLAFCHLFFNLSGILLFYPIPFLRFPIVLAKILGNTTYTYRWFPIFYLILVFILIPIIVFLLSIASNIVFMAVFVPIATIIVIVIIINILQERRPSMLPVILRNWDWLPEPLRSLDPLDRLISRVCCCTIGSRVTDSPTTGTHPEGLATNPGDKEIVV